MDRNTIRQAFSNGRIFKRYNSARVWAPQPWIDAYRAVHLDRVAHLMNGLLSIEPAISS